MPIPSTYEAVAGTLGSQRRLILSIAVGGLVALFAVVGVAAAFSLTVPAAFYEVFRVAAHAVALAWILAMLVFLFHPRTGILRLIKNRQGRAVVVLSWFSSWFGALLIDFGIAAVAISLMLT